MKAVRFGILIAAATCLISCNEQAERSGGGRNGRYLGIGVFQAGELWSKMAITSPAPRKNSATMAEDEHIIVVVDSHTGEIRECGDYSGVCVSMNPWTKAIAAEQVAPVTLEAHAADSVVENETEAADAPSAAP